MITAKYKKEAEHSCPSDMNGTHFRSDTPLEVKKVLENARVTKIRVRLFYGDTKTGKSWLDEYDVSGTISRSMGPVKIPILLNNSKSRGGCGIIDHCIVAIRTGSGFAYKHPKFHVPQMSIRKSVEKGFLFEVRIAGSVHARFKTLEQASRWVAFMHGERLSK